MAHARSWLCRGIFLILLMSVVVSSVAQQREPLQPAVPVDAITGILEAFRSYPLVALGEGPHNNVQGHMFRLSLIRDPRFAASVNDIVVEFGSARYQELIDRFFRTVRAIAGL